MAPYTMYIAIHNDSDSRLEWMGSSTYSPLDGETIVEYDRTIEAGQAGRVWISKSGGTDGLFTLASYDFPCRNTSLHIYAIMPAHAGSDATVKFVDHSKSNKEQLSNNESNGAATMWYKDHEELMMDGPWTSNVVEMGWGIQGRTWKYNPGEDPQEVWKITVRPRD